MEKQEPVYCVVFKDCSRSCLTSEQAEIVTNILDSLNIDYSVYVKVTEENFNK